MAEAMCREMEIRSFNLTNNKLNTIYFGGGTPSVLPVRLLEKLFHSIRSLFDTGDLEECTLEANPDDISDEKLKAWKVLGINRLSIGLQTFDDQTLLWMNRIHNSDEGKASVKRAQDAGFENISLDLMYHFPETGLQHLEKDTEEISRLNPTHISAYGLTLEPGTTFGQWEKKGKIKALPDDLAADEFQFLVQKLEEKGYPQYEISNFCRPGFEAKHNSAYWFQKPYLGIGPGAHGFDGENHRYENLPSNARYLGKLLKENTLWQKEETLSAEDKINEAILTRLRTKWGFHLKEWQRKTGLHLEIIKSSEIEKFEAQGLLIRKQDTLFLSPSGKLLADRIAAELMV